ncbi:Rqc2 family fibronectin-binding protein [Trichothermofontia sp.]
MQAIDFTTLAAACWELRRDWVPARLETVYQRDRYTILLALRTLDRRVWLSLSWHPQAARLCLSQPPPRTPDTFTFSEQLRHQLSGLALVDLVTIAPWERVIDLQFARRPGDAIVWHLYGEIMNKYSNVLLVNAENIIVTAAHQVSRQQSRVRPIQTGQPYELPPALLATVPSLSESFQSWRERLSVVPKSLKQNLLQTYRGLSSPLAIALMQTAGLTPDRDTNSLSNPEWQALFSQWQAWLRCLQTGEFTPGFTETGYTVLGWQLKEPVASVQELLDRYYTTQLNHQAFQQLQHRITQKLGHLQQKLALKIAGYQARLQESDRAEAYRQQADLLMAYPHQWQPGMQTITLAGFATGQPVQITLDPEKSAIQNAQRLYKKHQKLKRARSAIAPLLAADQAEWAYLEQVATIVAQMTDLTPEDLQALQEVRDELIQQGYLEDPLAISRQARAAQKADGKSEIISELDCHRYQTPHGFVVLIGRNNRQNDYLTFRLANEYDLWFHTQEIPGSHALLRLEPGAVPDEQDLQFAADLTAYYSRARESDRVPVIYTASRHVYKPKGAKPGMVIYKQETVIWGQPQRAKHWIASANIASANNKIKNLGRHPHL